MCLKQISISLENAPGQFLAVSEYLGAEGINIRAISVADTSDVSTVRFATDNPEKTANVLKSHGYAVDGDIAKDDEPYQTGKEHEILVSMLGDLGEHTSTA